MSKTRRRARRFLKRYKPVLIIIVFVLLSVVALLLVRRWDEQRGLFHSEGGAAPSISGAEVFRYKGTDYLLRDDVQSFLLIGLDDYEHSEDDKSFYNDNQADFLMLVVLDEETSEYSAIQINRDTMAEMNTLGIAGEKLGTAYKQIALAYTYGNGRAVSCRNTVDAVSALMLDIGIDHYVSLTMDSVKVANDLVGGVTVTVSDDFTGVDETLVQGSQVTLMGEQALTYIRARQGMAEQTNINRMARQKQYVQALIKKAQECAEKDSSFATDLAIEMNEYIISDCSATQLQAISEKLTGYTFKDIYEIEGTSVVGEEHMEFYHDGNALADTIVKLFYEPVAAESEAVTG